MHDVIIIGGSYAGLAAALQLARARRSVLVLDGGQRRNRFASHAHGFLGHDGEPPDVLAAKGRAEVLAYPTVTWRDTPATAVAVIPGGFLVKAGEVEQRGRRLILATGVSDHLPDIPGLAEHWGKRVFFCPYCHGYELEKRRLGVLATGPASAHFSILVSDWTGPGQTTFFLNGVAEPEAAELAQMEARGIQIERGRVVEAGGEAESVVMRLRDGRSRTVDGLFLMTEARLNGPFAQQLGCEIEIGPRGPYYKTDATKETTVPNVFACGDVGQPMPAIAYAIADGVRAGASAHQSLIFRS